MQRMARYGMDSQYGASEFYTGNGVTQYLGDEANNGVLEYMFQDNTGMTLQNLHDKGQLHIISCSPLKACPVIGVKND